KSLLQNRFNRARAQAWNQQRAAYKMRTHLDLLHDVFAVGDVLRQGHEEHRPRGLGGLRILSVAEHANDTERTGISRHIHPEMLIHGVFLREKPSHKSLVHEGNRRGSFVIGLGKASSAKNGLADGLKITGADAVP